MEPPSSRPIVGRASEISEAVTQTSAVTAQMPISESQRFGDVESSDMREGYRPWFPEAKRQVVVERLSLLPRPA